MPIGHNNAPRALHNALPFVEFIEWFNTSVEPRAFCMGLETRVPGQPEIWNLASWMRTFTASRHEHSLDYVSPCTYLGFDDPKEHTFYKLVMGQGDNYALDLFMFDQMPPSVRKGVAVTALCGVTTCGEVPWFSSLRSYVTHEDAKKMVMWRTA